MFSVIIPLKSFHNYLEPCFKSINSQTCKPDEIIFIFNNAEKKVKDFTNYFSKKYFYSIKLQFLESIKDGPGDARNKGWSDRFINVWIFPSLVTEMVLNIAVVYFI